MGKQNLASTMRSRCKPGIDGRQSSSLKSFLLVLYLHFCKFIKLCKFTIYINRGAWENIEVTQPPERGGEEVGERRVAQNGSK